MKHLATPAFWQCYGKLPASVRKLADEQFGRLKNDARHPSLHLKKVGRYFSVRVGLHHRALGVAVDEDVVWFWIGTHAEYDRMVR